MARCLECELEHDSFRMPRLPWESALEEVIPEAAHILHEGPARIRPGRRTSATPVMGSCPAPAQVARDRCIHPGTQTCPAIPNLLCRRDAAGLPFEYVLSIGADPATRLRIVSNRRVPVVERFVPAVSDALDEIGRAHV